MEKRALRGSLCAVLLTTACLQAFAGAVATKTPGKVDMDRVQGQAAAVVLLRIEETVDGKRVTASKEYDTNRLPRFYIARLDDLAAPQRTAQASLSKQAADDGWRYLVLAPGTYFLLVLPPGVEQNPPSVAYAAQRGRYGRLTQYEFKPGRGAFYSSDLQAYVFADSPPADFVELPGFWFEVPQGREIVYVGTLSLACKAGRGLFGSLIDSCAEFDLADEPDAATQLAAAAFPGMSIETRPMVPYGRARPGVAPLDDRGIPVTSRGPVRVDSAFTGARLAPWAGIPGVGAAFNVFNLLVTGGQLLDQSSDERRARSRAAEMQPCADRLSASVADLDLAAAFASALSAVTKPAPRAHDALPAGAIAPLRRWSVSLPVLQLRETGQPDLLALELGLAVRLEQVDTGRLDYFALVVSGPGPLLQDPHAARSPLYAELLPDGTEPRSLAQWCGPDGVPLLSSDVDRALEKIAERIAKDY